ncbi:hypothetical protein ANTQUA_LOCUS990 [Anthophora quadrimaculata]
MVTLDDYEIFCDPTIILKLLQILVRQPSFQSTRSEDNSSSSTISRNSTGSSGSHQPRDLDLPAKRFTLVNPGISGYHSGSRSRD